MLYLLQCGLDHMSQMRDGEEIAKLFSYRQLPGGTSYSNPKFHAVLRKSLKGRDNKFTTHDAAFVDLICDCQFRKLDMQKMSVKGIGGHYAKFLDIAKKNLGTHGQGDVTIEIVAPSCVKGYAFQPVLRLSFHSCGACSTCTVVPSWCMLCTALWCCGACSVELSRAMVHAMSCDVVSWWGAFLVPWRLLCVAFWCCAACCALIFGTVMPAVRCFVVLSCHMKHVCRNGGTMGENV